MGKSRVIAAVCILAVTVVHVLRTHSATKATYGAHLATWRRLELLMPQVSRNIWMKLESSMEKFETAVASGAAKGAVSAAVGIGSWMVGKAFSTAAAKTAAKAI